MEATNSKFREEDKKAGEDEEAEVLAPSSDILDLLQPANGSEQKVYKLDKIKY